MLLLRKRAPPLRFTSPVSAPNGLPLVCAYPWKKQELTVSEPEKVLALVVAIDSKPQLGPLETSTEVGTAPTSASAPAPGDCNWKPALFSQNRITWSRSGWRDVPVNISPPQLEPPAKLGLL